MKNTEIIIRAMQKDDIAKLVSWLLESPLWQRYKLNQKIAANNFQKALKTGDELIVALSEDEICGFAWLQPNAFLKRSPYLKMIGVKQGYQSLGIGYKLISYLEQDKNELFLLVSNFNISAQKFYKKQGYKQIGTIPNYILEDVDELIFYKRLNIE